MRAHSRSSVVSSLLGGSPRRLRIPFPMARQSFAGRKKGARRSAMQALSSASNIWIYHLLGEGSQPEVSFPRRRRRPSVSVTVGQNQ